MRRHSKGSIPRLCAEETSGTSLVARCLLWQGTGYGRISTWRDGLYENPVQLCHAGAPRKIKSIDLPLRVKRKNARKRVRERKKKFGRSIDERDPSVDERQDFGHWECDLVLGSRSKDEVLLTLVERKTRCSLIRKLPNKESASVIAAFRKLKDGMFRGCFSRVFLSITTDNGSEFSSLSELEKLSHTRIYYAHPYCSSDKGTNENHNGLFRRFLPKGKKSRITQWNTFPE